MKANITSNHNPNGSNPHKFSRTKSSQNLAFKLLQSALILLAAIAFVAAVHPDVRASVRSSILSDMRTVVSTAKGNLSGTASTYTVAKVKTRDNIYLEIFETILEQMDLDQPPASTQHLVERIELNGAHDAYFTFNGQTTNLAIDDINGDGKPEILVPTFDKNLVGRLNVIEYDRDSREFRSVIQ